VNVTFRELQEYDVDCLLRWRNNPEVNRYLTNLYRTREEITAWYRRILADGNALLCGIDCDGVLVGYGVVDGGIAPVLRKCEVGVVIGEPQFWGHGLGKRVVQHLLQYGFEQLHLHRVLAVIAQGNTRSERLFQRLGFIHEGTLRDATMIDGKFTDLLCYSMLEDEYRRTPPFVEGGKT
jgi:RimJ/RimL family protein N-acetyltransferase